MQQRNKMLKKSNIKSFLIGAAVVFAACGGETKIEKTEDKLIADSIKVEETVVTVPDSVVVYLINSAVADFVKNQKPVAENFRNVEIRNLTGPKNQDNFMICGEFLTTEEKGNNKWTNFATIKTRAYEQWIGAQSIGYCKESKSVSNRYPNLAQEMKKRLDELTTKK